MNILCAGCGAIIKIEENVKVIRCPLCGERLGKRAEEES